MSKLDCITEEFMLMNITAQCLSLVVTRMNSIQIIDFFYLINLGFSCIVNRYLFILAAVSKTRQ